VTIGVLLLSLLLLPPSFSAAVGTGGTTRVGLSLSSVGVPGMTCRGSTVSDLTITHRDALRVVTGSD
jgi:hypothetical protein